MNDQQKEALRLAGVMADAALCLVGGRGMYGRSSPVGIIDLSLRALELREATEAYNDHILSMEKNK